MSSEQAMKVTLAAFVIGSAAIIYSGRQQLFSVNFKRIWGLTLLAGGASILSDVAPKAVGPYMALVGLVFLLAPQTGLGKLLKGAETGASQGGAPAVVNKSGSGGPNQLPPNSM